MDYSLRPLSQVDFNAFVKAFNQAYADYFVPMHLTTGVMRDLIARESVVSEDSRVAVNGAGRIVGMGMLAVRGRAGWIGGMGVIPDYRRQGIARHILTTLVETARLRGLTHVDLEVISHNTAAYSLYEATGFKKRRVLAILERGLDGQATLAAPSGHRLRTARPHTALMFYDAFHDVPNPWQRSRPAIEALADSMTARLLTPDDGSDTVLAYAIGWFNPQRLQFMDVAAHPGLDDRLPVMQALLQGLHHEFPGATGGIINVGEDDIMLRAMQDVGYRQSLRQYEMRLDL